MKVFFEILKWILLICTIMNLAFFCINPKLVQIYSFVIGLLDGACYELLSWYFHD